MTVDHERQRILRTVYKLFRDTGCFPEVKRFRVEHEDNRHLLDDLREEDLLRDISGRYALTPKGLWSVSSSEVREEFKAFSRLVGVLKECYRQDPGKVWRVPEIAERADDQPKTVVRVITLFIEAIPTESYGWETKSSLIMTIKLREEILDLNPSVWPFTTKHSEFHRVAVDQWRIRRVSLDGYRLFSDFQAQLGNLTVVIGANGTGKSSLFDFFRLLSFSSVHTLPNEVDPHAQHKSVYSRGSSERIQFSVETTLSGSPGLRYEAEIRSPGPTIGYERLWSIERPKGLPVYWPFLSFKNGKGQVRDPGYKGFGAETWRLDSGELALRRAVNPNMLFVSSFRDYVASWGVYSSIEFAGSSKSIASGRTQAKPLLAPSGGNLTAMLFRLLTEDPDGWDRLLLNLREVVPGFQSISVKASEPDGSIIGVWRETGSRGDLTLADLSDGIRLFLTWIVLLVSSRRPPFLCIDEPELGLHPRALPALAATIKDAAQDSQIVVTTHSPYFLSLFDIADIAVMKRGSGAVEFARPTSKKALRDELRHLDSSDFMQMHISDELETRA